ncbi:MAG: NADP-dependent phosphogluconate dehydrogenase [Cyclobacteriaceae bacterium]
MLNKSEFGLLGLGVMGKSLCRNLAQKGFLLSIYNRHVDNVEEDVALNFKAQHPELESARSFDELEAFVQSIEQPRKIMLMVNAGKTTDLVIEDLLQHVSAGDVLIDGGNSHYEDTKRRSEYLKEREINFIGTGVSGGEEGALKGPSIMPGGDPEVYKMIQPYLEAIAAKDGNGRPCCTFIGREGSGHFVKMVHNGIEYAEMQLICEVVSVLKSQGKSNDEIADILTSWESSGSYLLEITIAILRKREGDGWLLDSILDKAGNKGTGNWTAVATAKLGVPSSLITSALYARYSSFYKEERTTGESLYKKNRNGSSSIAEDELAKAYEFARIINHYQGFKLISEASKSNNWSLKLSEIARIWTNGCIIRSGLMEELISVLREGDNLLFHKAIVEKLNNSKTATSRVVAQSILDEIAIPCLSEAINFFSGITTANSSANLIQAQRDYFGAHTYQRVDDLTEKYYHTKWQEEDQQS